MKYAGDRPVYYIVMDVISTLSVQSSRQHQEPCGLFNVER